MVPGHEIGGVQAFKKTVYDLTRVPPDRQKLMAKGAWVGMLKDEADFTMMPLKSSGQIVMLMGTAEVVEQSSVQTVFLEDMTAEQQAEAGVTLPAGLANLGNTCYLNATVQVLRQMRDLRGRLKSLRSHVESVDSGLVNRIGDTLDRLDSSAASIAPVPLVDYLRRAFPMYAQRSTQGIGFMQQDAEEFYNTMTAAISATAQSGDSRAANVMDEFLTLEIEEKLTCQESPDEPVVVKKDKVNKLVCAIQSSNSGSATSSINTLEQGLQLDLEGNIEKHSALLDRDAVWKKEIRIDRLSKYICVQYMRFFWKPTPESRDHTGVKCKIMRPIVFTEVSKACMHI